MFQCFIGYSALHRFQSALQNVLKSVSIEFKIRGWGLLWFLKCTVSPWFGCLLIAREDVIIKATFEMQKQVVPDWFEFGPQQKERALVPIESLTETTSRDTQWGCLNHVPCFSASGVLLHGLSSNQKSTSWRLKLTGITRDHPSFKAQNWEIIRFWALHVAPSF